jgi:SsrA-binding protein
MGKKPSKAPNRIIENRKARHDYFIEDTLEAGIVLQGSEVKSLRAGNINITDAYVDEKQEEMWLLQAYIGEYKGANRFNHQPKRPRKLLLNKQEIKKLIGKLKVKGLTIVPLSFYFNDNNIVKVEIGIAKGKKLHDKRETEKQRDWNRQKLRVLKGSDT